MTQEKIILKYVFLKKNREKASHAPIPKVTPSQLDNF